jgi:hypothetical protein
MIELAWRATPPLSATARWRGSVPAPKRGAAAPYGSPHKFENLARPYPLGKGTQTEFQYLVAYRNSAEFKSIMTRIRHSLTFHYDAGTTEKAGLTIARSARRTSRLW